MYARSDVMLNVTAISLLNDGNGGIHEKISCYSFVSSSKLFHLFLVAEQKAMQQKVFHAILVILFVCDDILLYISIGLVLFIYLF